MLHVDNEAYAPRPPKAGASNSELYAAFKGGYLSACGELGPKEEELGSAFINVLENVSA
jgi:hypothetical protein